MNEAFAQLESGKARDRLLLENELG